MIDPGRSRILAIAVRIVLMIGLAWFYYAGATEHARRVNGFKARGDQSGYLYDAQVLYRNWHGLNRPPRLVDRNRMPLYGAYQAWLYDPGISNDDFFIVAKHRNIVLSLVLLGLIAIGLAWHLPPLAATNLTLVIAFGYFIFKAGYVQSELLFYFLFFATFVACWHLFAPLRPAGTLVLSAVAGALAALSHLTKAAVLPFAVLFVLVYVVSAIGSAARSRRSGRQAIWRLAGAAVFVVTFLSVLSPYLIHSKRQFRQYFYNVNSNFYVWYDDWGEALSGTYLHGDHEHWPDMPRGDLPGPRKYFREHTFGQIAARLLHGMRDMVVVSYNTYWCLKFLVLYAGFAGVLVATRTREVLALVKAHPALFGFLVLYGILYFLMIAFYEATSGTGTARFLLAHVAPLLFALSVLFGRFPSERFQWIVAITIGLDLVFVIWPRLMSTYGGF